VRESSVTDEAIDIEPSDLVEMAEEPAAADLGEADESLASISGQECFLDVLSAPPSSAILPLCTRRYCIIPPICD
jgi:hypothetical protein